MSSTFGRDEIAVIIDDDAAHRFAFSQLLESFGWKVHAAAGGSRRASCKAKWIAPV